MAEHVELQIEVKVGGSETVPGDNGSVEIKHGKYIQRVQVDQRLDAPDFFSVEIQATEFNEVIMWDKIGPGAEVEVSLGYGGAEKIFQGEVSYLEPHFDAGHMYLTISGYDMSHRLTRGTSSRTFGDGHKADQNPGSILGSVVGDSSAREGGSSDGLSAQTKSASSKLEYIAQYNLNDYQFIQQVVGSFGMGWDSQSHKAKDAISLKPIEVGGEDLVVYRDKPQGDPQKDAQAVSADFRMSTVRQVAKVEVRGWDFENKKPILGEAKAYSSVVEGTAGNKQAGKAHYGSASAGRVLTIVDLPVRSKDEAKEVAQSILDKLGMDFLTADVVIEGRPKVHAGSVVKLMEFGTRYSGKYIVESCQHVYIAGAPKPYRTYLKLVRNGAPEAS